MQLGQGIAMKVVRGDRIQGFTPPTKSLQSLPSTTMSTRLLHRTGDERPPTEPPVGSGIAPSLQSSTQQSSGVSPQRQLNGNHQTLRNDGTNSGNSDRPTDHGTCKKTSGPTHGPPLMLNGQMGSKQPAMPALHVASRLYEKRVMHGHIWM